MIILPYFIISPMGKLKFQFSLSVSTQFDLYQHQSGEHVENKSRKACKTGAILVISIFTELLCSSSASFPVELQYLNNRNTNKHETLHV